MEQRGAFHIARWGECFENNRSRQLKYTTWVPLPNSHDGASYRMLVEEYPSSRVTVFTGWVLMVQVGSRCTPRGWLMRRRGTPHTPGTLARVTGMHVSVFETAIPILTEDLGWLEEVDLSTGLILRGRGAGNIRVPESCTVSADDAEDTDRVPDSSRGVPESRTQNAKTAFGRRNLAEEEKRIEEKRNKSNALFSSRNVENVDNPWKTPEASRRRFIGDVERLMFKLYGPGWMASAANSIGFATKVIKDLYEGRLSPADVWGTVGDAQLDARNGKVRSIPRVFAALIRAKRAAARERGKSPGKG